MAWMKFRKRKADTHGRELNSKMKYFVARCFETARSTRRACMTLLLLCEGGPGGCSNDATHVTLALCTCIVWSIKSTLNAIRIYWHAALMYVEYEL